MSQKRESTIRNLLRDPVEHNLWQTFYPVIAEWSQRPYFRDTAMKLTIGASRFCFAAMSAEHYPYALRKWRSVQADFIAETEYQSFGAISTKLLESGDGVSAELICEMAARRGAAIEKAQRSQAQKRHELKRMLSESGLSSLLADERYVPAAFETLGDVPAKIDPANPQFSIFSPPRLKVVVKSVYAPIERTDGFRVLCDHFPPRIYPSRASPYDLRARDILPSQRLFSWFNNDPERWVEFQHYHHRQLHGAHSSVLRFIHAIKGESITLLHLDRGELSIAQSLRSYFVQHLGSLFE